MLRAIFYFCKPKTIKLNLKPWSPKSTPVILNLFQDPMLRIWIPGQVRKDEMTKDIPDQIKNDRGAQFYFGEI